MNSATQTDPNLRRFEWIVIVVAALIFLISCISPPYLQDDVDAVQAQISRTMLDSGDWVTAHLDGVPYLEKAPLKYWMIACSYAIFGVHDWAARLPIALSTIALCWLTVRFGAWAFSARAGFYAGLALATCIGLFLFTRVLIPDVILTLTITLAMWSLLRTLDPEESRPRLWAAVMAAAIGTGLLLKGLIAALFPVAAGLLYLAFTHQLFMRETWRRLRPLSGIAIILLIAAPWHILATLRNPPYLDFTLHAGPGEYRGFFWFYFFNEHLLRFLNLRYPRDYNTVPRSSFWLLHLLWLFPWSAYLPALSQLKFGAQDRASQVRLLALCWIGFLLIFFSFSTTQEYYSMPCYPAFALLLGCAMERGGKAVRGGSALIAGLAALAALAIVVILSQVWNTPAPGDISQALVQHPDAYTLSLGHMGDLTLQSFAYLRLPLIVAGIAFLIGALGYFWRPAGALGTYQPYLTTAAMMVLFFQAARLALITFDPYLGSHPLAEALTQQPPGTVIVDNQYYAFSSIFFYANTKAKLLNGRVNNIEYGSYAPGAPDVFLNDRQFAQLWPTQSRYYLFVEGPAVPRIEKLVGHEALHLLAASGGKFLYANHARPY